MPSPVRHRLLDYAKRSSTVDGPSVVTAGRTAWSVEFELGLVTTSITIKIQASVDGGTTWSDIYEVTKNSEDSWIVEGSVGAPNGFDTLPEAYHTHLRVSVSATGGDYVLGAVGRGRIIDLNADLADYLPEEIRSSTDVLPRAIERAEGDVIDLFDWNDDGESDLDLTHPQFLDRARRAVAIQAERVVQRHLVQQSSSEDKEEELKKLRGLDPAVQKIMAPVVGEDRTKATSAWKTFGGRS